ncbi:MAG: hypothetical protein ACREQ5_27180 [Candidatus Dormibacteria bacterium]
MSGLGLLGAAAAGMDAERAALELAAHNVAAAQASPTGGSFERLVPHFALAPLPGGSPPLELPVEDLAVPEPAAFGDDSDGDDAGDGLAADGTPGSAVAGDPPIRYLGARSVRGTDADAIVEMVAVLDAQRAYESDASLFDLGKRLAERTIDLGRLS